MNLIMNLLLHPNRCSFKTDIGFCLLVGVISYFVNTFPFSVKVTTVAVRTFAA